ncbi:hypothetical protein FRC04_005754 [Tulasnella sp. 424]|nr:hypothetical protein FRC04_005754 [Tulasnella sp. 424]
MNLQKVARLFKGAPKLQGSAQADLLNATQYAPLIGAWFRRHSRTINLRSGRANVFLIICLCYEGLEWPGGGSMGLAGPQNDLLLLLRNLQYRHQNEDRQFLIFTDFEVRFEDHTGISGTVATLPATRDNIATRVQDTMRDLDRGDKCVMYYSGHIELDPQGGGSSARIILHDDEGIYDHELRAWLNQSRFPTTTIVAIFDACYSGGFLGLPYVHTKGDRHIGTTGGAYGERMNSQVVEISSTSRDQLSFSEMYKEGEESETTHGILSWHLLKYLKVNPRPNLHDLAAHIYSKCDTPWIDERDGRNHEWHQVPVLSSSRRIGGKVSLL